jgi:hypothetical protein
MSDYRIVEWQVPHSGYLPGWRETLPKPEAEAAIRTGTARGVTPIKFIAAYRAYAPGESAGFYDDEAEWYIRRGWAEPVPVAAPIPVRPPDADVDGETKAISAAPHDRMIHHAPKTKAVKP